jgi:5-methylcytosine-specific restriction endonuclease McrA
MDGAPGAQNVHQNPDEGVVSRVWKRCARELKKWIRSNRERQYANVARWAAAHPEVGVAKAERYRARKLRATGNWTARDFQALKGFHLQLCACCGKPSTRLAADHIYALVAGGSNDGRNVQPLCKKCNCSKRDRTTAYTCICGRHVADPTKRMTLPLSGELLTRRMVELSRGALWRMRA